MYFEKRYQGTERDRNGKLICTFSYSAPEEFDQHISQYPPMAGHVVTLFDSWTTLDRFGLIRKVVREVTGGKSMGKCYNCKFLRHHKQPGSIGICTLHWVTAIDSLCGCKKGGDGKYTLKNFSIENSALEVTRVERKKYDA